MAFKPRTTTPNTNDKWWRTDFNPCLPRMYGTVLPNCVGYAWGRFAEIMNGVPEGLPRCDAGEWYAADTTHQKGKKPKLGAVLVLGQRGNAGHVAIVEKINSDGSILTSESGYSVGWNQRFWTSTRYPPEYIPSSYGQWDSPGAGFYFIGFIYNPAVTDSVTIDDPEHPARIFVAEAEKHVGAGGHTWVQQQTSIGNSRWAAAMLCAVAKEIGLAGKVMPGNKYVASEFGSTIISKYGGEYHAGPALGGSFTPQTGDIIEFTKFDDRKAGNQKNFKYSAYHVGVVKEVIKDNIYTIEGDVSNRLTMRMYKLNGPNIGWYARPKWSIVDGSSEGEDGVFSGGTVTSQQLYTSRSTRADASVREVCYLTPNCEPSINISQVRLAAINYTGLLADFVSVFGSSSVSGSDNIDGVSPPVAREIVAYLLNKGLCSAAAVGVIANIKAESGFDVGAEEKGPPYQGRGLCQWSFERRTAMIAFVGPDWKTDLTGQLDYLWSELTGSYYRPIVLEPLQKVPNTLEGAKDAAEVFVRKFEVPGGMEAAVRLRRQYAEEFWNMVIVDDSLTSKSDSQHKITAYSGKALSSGNATTFQSSVSQTGIIAKRVDISEIAKGGPTSKKIYSVWESSGRNSLHTIATINKYYLIELPLKFAKPGDIVSVVLSDDTYFVAIVADNFAGNSLWGEYDSAGKIYSVKWVTLPTVDSLFRSELNSAGWLNKTISRIVNHGSWLDK